MMDATTKRLAAMIARDLFTDGNGERIRRLVMEHNNGTWGAGWAEGAMADRIAQILHVAQAAFDAVLTEQNAALARVERQLAEADAVIAGHWQGHANDGQTWRLEDQPRPVREAIERFPARQDALRAAGADVLTIAGGIPPRATPEPKGRAMKFRKKPVVIEAVQWAGDNLGAVEAFCCHIENVTRDEHGEDQALVIETLEGRMIASRGDWIIRGVKGEFYPCKPDIFAATYEPVTAPDRATPGPEGSATPPILAAPSGTASVATPSPFMLSAPATATPISPDAPDGEPR